jgi:hypothetical protein
MLLSFSCPMENIRFNFNKYDPIKVEILQNLKHKY